LNPGVITDRVDEGIKKIFIEAAHELLRFGSSPKQKEIKGFDPGRNEVVKGKTFSNWEDSTGLLEGFPGLSFSITYEDSSLTLVADVIANSLHHHFRARKDDSLGKALNTNEAIKGHTLEKNFYGTWDNTEQNYYADAVYIYPKDQ
jgi:hypothetical protein